MKTHLLLKFALSAAIVISISACASIHPKLAGEPKFITGNVTSIAVSGYGPASAQLQFTVGGEVFVANAYPAHEPQVFSSTATLLSIAYVHSKKVSVQYQPGEPNRTIAVFLPPQPIKR